MARLSDKKRRFEWLKDYLDLDDEIRFLTWKIRKAQNEERRWTTGDLKNVRLERDSKGSHVMDNVPEYEAALTECKAEQYDLLQLINTFSGYENQLLRLKYVEGLSLEEVAERLGYSYETIRAKHSELHRRLDFIDDWEEQRDQLDSKIADEF